MAMSHADFLKAYLEDCCNRLDRGLRPLPFRKLWRAGALASLAVGLSAGLTACGGDTETAAQGEGENPDDGVTDSEDNAAKADGVSHPQGTYEVQGDGELALVLINSDKTFSAKLADGTGIAGTYKFTVANTSRYLRLGLEDGSMRRYQYKLTSTTLKLRRTNTSVWFTMTPLKENCTDGVDNDYDGSIDCGDSECTSKCGVKYGVPYESDCADDIDNDHDGKVDCADADCATSPTCGGTKYGIPYEGDCADDVDNDHDGKVDCADSDCETTPACQGTKYGIPYETDCLDGVDNDGDGKVDCADPDCGTSCGVKYGIPYESECGDDIDNDGDGLTDCADGDCASSSGCMGTKYGIPYEVDCTDGFDNDNDGKIDCADADCSTTPSCVGAKYAAPQQ